MGRSPARHLRHEVDHAHNFMLRAHPTATRRRERRRTPTSLGGRRSPSAQQPSLSHHSSITFQTLPRHQQPCGGADVGRGFAGPRPTPPAAQRRLPSDSRLRPTGEEHNSQRRSQVESGNGRVIPARRDFGLCGLRPEMLRMVGVPIAVPFVTLPALRLRISHAGWDGAESILRFRHGQRG
jgi:hypothetical protein